MRISVNGESRFSVILLWFWRFVDDRWLKFSPGYRQNRENARDRISRRCQGLFLWLSRANLLTFRVICFCVSATGWVTKYHSLVGDETFQIQDFRYDFGDFLIIISLKFSPGYRQNQENARDRISWRCQGLFPRLSRANLLIFQLICFCVPATVWFAKYHSLVGDETFQILDFRWFCYDFGDFVLDLEGFATD